MDNEELKKNIASGSQWMRLLYMVLFFFLLEIAGLVLLAVVLLQFLFALFTGSANDNLRRLGDQLASYVYQALQFLIYNSEEKPFPFSEWPESEVEDLHGYESAEEVQGEVIVAADDKAVEGLDSGSAQGDSTQSDSSQGDKADAGTEVAVKDAVKDAAKDADKGTVKDEKDSGDSEADNETKPEAKSDAEAKPESKPAAETKPAAKKVTRKVTKKAPKKDDTDSDSNNS
ncbi:hypothetical protein Maes01_00277 [Microbulbifer aestuariivivens]|uniref:DUF4389 domain-containing protein n=1 Tax=Microbulbifer aestuariivivens TaxID=1908308 RepID=A0ABP9WKK1_9GAMM